MNLNHEPARNRLLRLLLVLLLPATAQGHPGVGIVKDSRRNVFFTDLKQVWRIAPDGRLSVAVPGVHTHELCVDAEDNLYGEHLWVDDGRWRHRVWRLRPDGTLNNVIPTREGFLSDYSFVRDHAGNMYWADWQEQTVIKRRSPDGTITPYATARFSAVQWMTVTPDSTLFLMDGGDLRRVSPKGQVTTIAVRLSGQQPAPAEVSDRNYHMGLWTDRVGTVYIAVAREHLVLSVEANGRTQIVARSGGSWSPSGGVFDRDNKLWLLEYDSANAVRVRRIDGPGRERIYQAETSER